MSPCLRISAQIYNEKEATYKACHVTSVLCEFFCKSISLYTIMDSKYCLMFFGTFEFDNISGIGK